MAGSERHRAKETAEGLRDRRVRTVKSARRTTRVRSRPRRRLGWHPAELLSLLKLTFTRWSDDKVPKLAAALAYYTSLSLAPILLISIAVAGLVFGADAARGAVSQEISVLAGPRIGEGIESLLRSAWQPKIGTLATILGGIALLLGASGVFRELQDSLNIIWNVKEKAGCGIWGTIRNRFFSFVMVLGIGFLLLVSLVLSAGLAALGQPLGQGVLLRVLDQAITLLVITALFGAAFKFLPDAKTRWRDVGLGAFLTAALFTLGKSLIGLYLGRSAIGSTYGAAGSFVLVLLWINYSSQIFFFGAEFTKAWADTHGTLPRPISAREPQPGDHPRPAGSGPLSRRLDRPSAARGPGKK